MLPIRNAEEDLSHSYRFLRSLLSIIGAWPNLLDTSLLSKTLDYGAISVSYFVQLLVLIPGVLYVFLKEKNSRRQLKMVIPHVNGLAQILKYTVLLSRMSEFREALKDLRDDWLTSTEENRSIFRVRAKIGHKVLTVMVITMYSGGLSYRILLPILKGKIVLPNNVTIRLLPCPAYFGFFNEQTTPAYEIIFVLQVFGGFLNYTTLCGTIAVCSMFCLHLSSLLSILMNKLEELSTQADTSEKAVQQKIMDIVEYQTKIIRFLNNVEQVTPYIYFLEIIDDTCVACMLGYCIIMEWENSNGAAIMVYFTLQLSCIFTTFMMCYVGQLLIDESEKVRQSTIALNWYRIPMKNARSLILVISMSDQPIKLTAGKIVDISLTTFTDIIKTAMGYLNMLRTVI